MEWIKIEAGEYYSEDERFHILHTWDRINNLHWSLWDRIKNRNYVGESLKYCKQIAEKHLE